MKILRVAKKLEGFSKYEYTANGIGKYSITGKYFMRIANYA